MFRSIGQDGMSRLRRFHDDERGEQNMSTVMLLGVGALVVVGLIAVGVVIFKYANKAVPDATKDNPFPKIQ